MTLSFSTEINGKPNYFVEKIWKCPALTNFYSSHTKGLYDIDCMLITGTNWDKPDGEIKPKLHTIREDKHDRWKPGNNIHPVIKNRTPDRFQFAPTMKCVSVQTIEIKWFESKDVVVDTRYHLYNPTEYLYAYITIDGKNYPMHIDQGLFVNDGFDGKLDFFAYFNKNFTGKIIHWTDLKY